MDSPETTQARACRAGWRGCRNGQLVPQALVHQGLRQDQPTWGAGTGTTLLTKEGMARQGPAGQ